MSNKGQNKNTKKVVSPQQKTASIKTVKLLKGHQFMCPQSKVILKVNIPTVVDEVSEWMKMQEGFGLLEIVE